MHRPDSPTRAARRVLFPALVAALPFTVGCDDPLAGMFDPIMLEDTVHLAAPTAPESDLPSAIDVSAAGGILIGGARRPEIPSDPINWDLLVRAPDGHLHFVPPAHAEVDFDSRAGITRPVTDRTLDEIEEAPGFEAFLMDERVRIEHGARYIVRSRTLPQCGASQYSKIEVLELDDQAQTVSLRVVTNARCGDRRLVPA